jgi:hypothetical protein
MARFIRDHPMAIGVAIVALLATLGAVAAASGAAPRLTGWLSNS